MKNLDYVTSVKCTFWGQHHLIVNNKLYRLWHNVYTHTSGLVLHCKLTNNAQTVGYHSKDHAMRHRQKSNHLIVIRV